MSRYSEFKHFPTHNGSPTPPQPYGSGFPLLLYRHEDENGVVTQRRPLWAVGAAMVIAGVGTLIPYSHPQGWKSDWLVQNGLLAVFAVATTAGLGMILHQKKDIKFRQVVYFDLQGKLIVDSYHTDKTGKAEKFNVPDCKVEIVRVYGDVDFLRLSDKTKSTYIGAFVPDLDLEHMKLLIENALLSHSSLNKKGERAKPQRPPKPTDFA